MVTGNQHEVVAFLSDPRTYGPAGEAVARIDTHSAVVFLAGRRAVKLKRAVRYDYLDFSTAERRRWCCEAEVTLNRRTAPGLYRGVAAITREADGRLALNGAGPPVEWVVDMTRFPANALGDCLAERGLLPLDAMDALAEAVARLHAAAERRTDKGGLPGMRWVADGNRAGLDEFGEVIFGAPARDILTIRTAAVLDAAAGQLERRRRAGFVRQCHGDLHLRNIVLLDGVPTLFDAVEFNDDIACTDVLYDLAFLLMDLWRRDLRAHANLVLNAYLRRAGELSSLALLPLFLSCRAAVRAKTSATAATLAAAGEAAALGDTARDYLSLATGFLAPARPCVVAVGGRSGSGKSTHATWAAPLIGAAPGAVHLRSDVIRKELAGVPMTTRLPADAYQPDLTHRVYALMRDRAAEAVTAGHSVICDAVFGESAERDALAGVAAATGVPFVPLWLDAPEPALRARVPARTDDASDATDEVVRTQVAAGVDAPEWPHVTAGGSVADTWALVAKVLRARGVAAT